MIRCLITYICLTRLRKIAPEGFDGARAAAAVNACLAEMTAESAIIS